MLISYPNHTCVVSAVNMFTPGRSYEISDNTGLPTVRDDIGTHWSLAEIVLEGYASFVPTVAYAEWCASQRGVMARLRRLVRAWA